MRPSALFLRQKGFHYGLLWLADARLSSSLQKKTEITEKNRNCLPAASAFGNVNVKVKVRVNVKVRVKVKVIVNVNVKKAPT